MNIITDGKALNAEIKRIAANGKKLDASIHIAACSCLYHAETHSNADPAIRLVSAMPASSRKNALIAWFESFGKLKYDSKKKVMKYNDKGCTSQEDAQAKPFWEFKPEAEYKGFDIYKAMEQIIARAAACEELSMDDPKRSKNLIDPDALATLKALVAKAPVKA